MLAREYGYGSERESMYKIEKEEERERETAAMCAVAALVSN